MSGINRSYESETDQFLRQLEKETPLSESQKQEIAKHQAIFEKRDHAQKPEDERLKDF